MAVVIFSILWLRVILRLPSTFFLRVPCNATFNSQIRKFQNVML